MPFSNYYFEYFSQIIFLEPIIISACPKNFKVKLISIMLLKNVQKHYSVFLNIFKQQQTYDEMKISRHT